MYIPHVEGQLFAVMGLGRSGLSVARALQASGASVRCWDDARAQRETARQEGLPIADLSACPEWMNRARALILTPGLPHRGPKVHACVRAARQARLPVTGDIALFLAALAARQDCRVVGISGTNGKSTTSALLAHLLACHGFSVALGGNIGAPVFDLETVSAGGIYVIELSSFQIERTPNLALDVGLLTPVTPDHLERHGTFLRYAAIKSRLLRRSASRVICLDDAVGRRLMRRTAPRTSDRTYGLHRARDAQRPDLAYENYAGGRLLGLGQGALSLSEASALRGPAYGINAAAAAGAFSLLAPRRRLLASDFERFQGLKYRLSRIAVPGPVSYYNDSKATNPEACAAALSAFSSGLFLILGGVAKTESLSALAPHFPKIEQVYLIGAASKLFARLLEGQLPVRHCETLERAVALARSDAEAFARTGAASVLLSPAAASYDQFSSFEARGDAFEVFVRRGAATASRGERS